VHFPQDPGQQPMFPSAGTPPAYAPPPPIPSSGYRIPLSKSSTFPSEIQTGRPPFVDADGSPLFIGSAIFAGSVHPCKITQTGCMVPYGGQEHHHQDRFDLLPFDPNTMEFVRTSHGHIPAGRRPVEGGYEDNGNKLYHGIAVVNGVKTPGKTAPHLGGCNVSFAGGEHIIHDNYDILCWRS